MLQSSEERFDVREAIDELENYSFIEVTKSEKDAEEFIVVPFVASKFGQKKVSVHPLKSRILADTELLQQFGGAQPSDVRHGVMPRISKLIKFVARETERDPEALSRYHAIIEFIARRHPATWLLLSELYIDHGGAEALDEAKNCLRHYLESVTGPDTIDAWRTLAKLCRESDDAVGEVQALLELCAIREVPFHEISNAANRLNSVFSIGGIAVEGEEKRSLFEGLAAIMADRIAEASATDLSRLAWLYLNIREDAAARKYTRMGLSKEPDNLYCAKLAIRLGI